MNMLEAVKTCFAKKVTWKGRASRSEYWWWVVFHIIALLVATVADRMLGTTIRSGDLAQPYGYVYFVTILILFLPSLSVMIRRLHDTGHSGWWYWIALVPLLGVLLLLVWLCARGAPGPNRFGDDPLGSAAADAFS